MVAKFNEITAAVFLLLISGSLFAAETLLPIQYDKPYGLHVASKAEADMKYPVGKECVTINGVTQCKVIMGGRDITTRGMSYGDIIFKSDKTFELEILPKTKPNGKIVTKGGILRGAFSQDPVTQKLKLKLDQKSKTFTELSVFPNVSEVVDYASLRSHSLGTFNPASNSMGGKLKGIEQDPEGYELILRLDQIYKSSKGNIITLTHAFCGEPDCQLIKQVLK